MKLPRDLSGEDLARQLKKFGYAVTRQTGSHMRLTKRSERGEHHVTIPSHRVLKLGTLSSILAEVAAYHHIERDTLLKELFE